MSLINLHITNQERSILRANLNMVRSNAIREKEKASFQTTPLVLAGEYYQQEKWKQGNMTGFTVFFYSIKTNKKESDQMKIYLLNSFFKQRTFSQKGSASFNSSSLTSFFLQIKQGS